MFRFGSICLVVLLIPLGACTGQTVSTDAEASLGQYITVVEPASRKTAPALVGEDLAGKPLSSADFAGKTLVLNLWGPWCGPCRAEAPILKKVSDQYADQDVQFLGIVNDASSAWAASFNNKHQITYPNFADEGGRIEMGFNKSLPTQGVPTTWIIDSRGKVAVRIIEPKLTEATLTGLIDDVINKS